MRRPIAGGPQRRLDEVDREADDAAAMRSIRLAAGFFLLLTVGACSPSQGPPGSGSPSAEAPGTPVASGVRAACDAVAREEEALEISIDSTDDVFSTDLITGPRHCQPFVLVFTNNDPILHDVGISTEELGQGESLLLGEKITGPRTIRYEVDGIPAGDYYFVCTLHWQSMNGRLIVAAPG